MKLHEFNKFNLNILRSEINSALEAVNEKFGIKIELGHISYNPTAANGKLAMQIIQTASGEKPLTPEEQAFVEIAPVLGITIKLNEEFAPSVGSIKRAKFVGYMTRRNKYPFVILDVDTGKRFKIGSDYAVSISKKKSEVIK